MIRINKEELENITVGNLQKLEGREHVTDVTIQAQEGYRYNWRVSTINRGVAMATFDEAQNAVIEKLQQEYELIADTD